MKLEPLFCHDCLFFKSNFTVSRAFECYKYHVMPMEEGMLTEKEIDSARQRFPYCIVWTPLPLLS